MVASSLTASGSWRASTVTVFAVAQSTAVKRRLCGAKVTSASEPAAAASATVTASVGCEVSATV